MVGTPFWSSPEPRNFLWINRVRRCSFHAPLEQHGISCKILVYLDDFLLIAPDHTQLTNAFDALDDESARLGLVWKKSKDVGRSSPTYNLSFLGLQLDSTELSLRLPDDKRSKYVDRLHAF